MRALTDTWTMTKRSLRHTTRSLDTIITVVVTPIALLLLFVYVFGGALGEQTGSIEPEQMPLWINAANAVLVTSDYEGFGMAAVEALACGVPVLSTAVGIAPYALAGIEGCLCAEFEPERWAAVARAHLDARDPRVDGSARAASLSAASMAERVIEAYRDVIAAP